MEILHIEDTERANLKGFVLDNSIANTESDLFLYRHGDIEYVLKELNSFDKNKFDNRVRTLLSIDSNSVFIPDYFIKPEFLVSLDYELRYWASRRINGINFNSILNDNSISLEVKKKYLKKIGYILKHMDYIRRSTVLKDFYIGDLHESNFIVDKNDKLLICDVDSMKINGNRSSVSKYINPFSLFGKAGTKKYRLDTSPNRIADYIVDKNTDLYCYIIMIMNFLCGGRINDISIEDFYRYLNYLDSIGIDHNMIEMFNKIILEEDNSNPCYYIDSLSEDKIVKARRKICK